MSNRLAALLAALATVLCTSTSTAHDAANPAHLQCFSYLGSDHHHQSLHPLPPLHPLPLPRLGSAVGPDQHNEFCDFAELCLRRGVALSTTSAATSTPGSLLRFGFKLPLQHLSAPELAALQAEPSSLRLADFTLLVLAFHANNLCHLHEQLVGVLAYLLNLHDASGGHGTRRSAAPPSAGSPHSPASQQHDNALLPLLREQGLRIVRLQTRFFKQTSSPPLPFAGLLWDLIAPSSTSPSLCIMR